MSEGDGLKMGLRETSEPRSAGQEIKRQVENFKRGSSSQGKYWLESTSTSEVLALHTPEDVRNELNAIENRYKKHPRRPHEWLSNKAEERLRELKEKDPASVRERLNQLFSEVEDFQTEVKDFEKDIDGLKQDHKDIKSTIEATRQSEANPTAGSLLDTSLQKKEERIKKLRDTNEEITLTHVSLLVVERIINERQRNNLLAEKKELGKVMEKINSEQMITTQEQRSRAISMLAFNKGATWSSVKRDTEKIDRDLQASIARRDARIKKINDLLELPESQPVERSASPIQLVDSPLSQSEYDLGGDDTIQEVRRKYDRDGNEIE